MHTITMPLAQAILHELATRGPLLKGQLAEATGASPMSVTGHLRHLEDAGLVKADAPAGARNGKRVLYDVDRRAVIHAIDVLVGYLLADGDLRIAKSGSNDARPN